MDFPAQLCYTVRMKKVRRIIAWIGIVALVALYVTALVLVIIGNDQAMRMFWVAIFATVVLPVLLWAYQFIYKLLKRDYSEEARAETEKMRADMKKAREASKKAAGDADDKETKSSGD